MISSAAHRLRQLRFSGGVAIPHILNVLGLCSNVKMLWIRALSIIAFVKHGHAFRNRTKSQNPCGFVSQNSCSIAAFCSNLPISERVFCSVPSPARTKLGSVSRYRTILCYLFPKAIWEGFRKTLRQQIGRSNLNHSTVFALHSLRENQGLFI